MARFEAPVMNTNLRGPASSASSTAYWMSGLSTTGSISLGLALVAGRNRGPRPATGNTAVRMAGCDLMRKPQRRVERCGISESAQFQRPSVADDSDTTVNWVALRFEAQAEWPSGPMDQSRMG